MSRKLLLVSTRTNFPLTFSTSKPMRSSTGLARVRLARLVEGTSWSANLRHVVVVDDDEAVRSCARLSFRPVAGVDRVLAAPGVISVFMAVDASADGGPRPVNPAGCAQADHPAQRPFSTAARNSATWMLKRSGSSMFRV